jgi:predicted DNA-binding antitoxin AbrB/MazE fold protein
MGIKKLAGNGDKGENNMRKTIRAKFSKGVIKPLEKLDLEEGEEITVTIMKIPKYPEEGNLFTETAGSWKDLIDCDELIKNIYEDWCIATRLEPKL